VRRLWHGAPDFGVVFEPSALSPRLAQAKLLREQLLELQTRVDVAEQARQALADDRLLCVRSLKPPFQSALFELMTAYPPAAGHPGLAPGAPPGWQGAASNLRLYLECGGTLLSAYASASLPHAPARAASRAPRWTCTTGSGCSWCSAARLSSSLTPPAPPWLTPGRWWSPPSRPPNDGWLARRTRGAWAGEPMSLWGEASCARPLPPAATAPRAKRTTTACRRGRTARRRTGWPGAACAPTATSSTVRDER